MLRNKFGWSYPPGAASDPYAPYNQPEMPCEVCGKEAGACDCTECPECGVQGRAACQTEHGLKMPCIANLRGLLKEYEDDTPYQLGRALYRHTECGPWIVFLCNAGEDNPLHEVYYESEEAHETDWLDDCVGIKVGSIVEGSDNGIEPITLMFPFTSQAFSNAVESINHDAGIVWEWANVLKDKNGRRNPNGKTDAERGLDWPLF